MVLTCIVASRQGRRIFVGRFPTLIPSTFTTNEQRRRQLIMRRLSQHCMLNGCEMFVGQAETQDSEVKCPGATQNKQRTTAILETTLHTLHGCTLCWQGTWRTVLSAGDCWSNSAINWNNVLNAWIISCLAGRDLKLCAI